MSWLLNLHPVDHPRVDDVHLCLGRAAYVAAQFDRDVASLVLWLELPAVWSEFRTWSPEQIEVFQIAIVRRRLVRRLEYTTRELQADPVEVDLLATAREARNSLVREMPRIPLHVHREWGSFADLTIPRKPQERWMQVLVNAVDRIRPWVTSLTPGCALVGSWLFSFSNGRPISRSPKNSLMRTRSNGPGGFWRQCGIFLRRPSPLLPVTVPFGRLCVLLPSCPVGNSRPRFVQRFVNCSVVPEADSIPPARSI